MNHRPNMALCALGLLVAVVVVLSARRKAPEALAEPPLEAPVPMQEWTTADAGQALAAIPSPGPNQKRKCDPGRAEQEINGGCWVKTETPPPCPRGKQWEHEGRCYLPVAEAKPVPTSGGGYMHGEARVSGKFRDNEP